MMEEVVEDNVEELMEENMEKVRGHKGMFEYFFLFNLWVIFLCHTN